MIALPECQIDVVRSRALVSGCYIGVANTQVRPAVQDGMPAISGPEVVLR